MQDATDNPYSLSLHDALPILASGPGGTLANASATTTGSGAASFSGLTLSGTVGSYTLRFEDTNLTPATSSAITLSAGAATTIAENGGNGRSEERRVGKEWPPPWMARDRADKPGADVTVACTAT